MFTSRSAVFVSHSKSLTPRLLSTVASCNSCQLKSGTGCKENLASDSSHRLPGTMFHVEGYQGDLTPLPIYKAKQLLSQAQRHSVEGPGVQGIQGYGTVKYDARSFHTSIQRSSVDQSAASKLVDVDNDSSLQGIQGDDCINFKLWMDTCRTYGLSNCDEQLQGIQSGRKTLAEVMAEQNQLIHSISEKYRQAAAEKSQAGTEQDQAEAGVQGVQGFGSFPSVHAPCPQGVQGEDCARFKLWLENCHRFGFSECMDQLETIRTGRKSLGQVFAEQDQLIKSVVVKYQQTRRYSSSSSSSSSGGDSKSDPKRT